MTVPTDELPPAIPSTLHVTTVLAVFASVAVNVCVAPAVSVAAPGATETVTDIADCGQVPLFAAAGTEVFVDDELRVTSAVSVRPASSVTVTWTTIAPDDGATTTALGVLAPCIGVVDEPTMLHAYEAIE